MDDDASIRNIFLYILHRGHSVAKQGVPVFYCSWYLPYF
nr:MAG TPA: hypothetical protein [Caudoviricetes sp.]